MTLKAKIRTYDANHSLLVIPKPVLDLMSFDETTDLEVTVTMDGKGISIRKAPVKLDRYGNAMKS